MFAVLGRVLVVFGPAGTEGVLSINGSPLHVGVPKGRANPAVVEHEGVTSFKLFMAYPGVLYSDDGQIFRAMQKASENGGTIMMHAENGIVIDVLREQGFAQRAVRGREPSMPGREHLLIYLDRRAYLRFRLGGVPGAHQHQGIGDSRARGRRRAHTPCSSACCRRACPARR
mgnify:CR=1 FL=1